MDELKTLFRQSLHYLAGRVGIVLLGFVSFPLFTRMLSVSDYGLMSLVLKLASIFAVMSKLGLQHSLLRFWNEHASSEKSDGLQRFFSSMFFGAIGTSLAAALLFSVGISVIPTSAVGDGLKQLLLFSAFLILIRGMFSVLAAVLRVQEMTKTYNILDVAQKAGTILASCVFFFAWRRDVWALITGPIVAEGLVVLFISVFVVQRSLLVPKLFDAGLFRQALFFGLPLSILEFSSIILDSGDRVLVQHYLGSEQLGYYSAVYNLSTYLEAALVVPLNLALFPIYMKIWAQKGREETQAFLSRGLELLLLLNIGVLVPVALTSGDAMTVLASPKYHSSHRLLPILVAGLLLYAMHFFLSAGLLIHKKTFTAARMVIYACIFNIVMNIILIPRMGLLAAAVATFASYAFLVVILGRASFKVLPFRVEWSSIARYLLAGALAVAAVWRLDLGNSVLNLIVKSLLGLSLYAGAVWLLNPRVRDLITKVSEARRVRTDGVAVAAVAQTVPMGED